MTIRLSLAAPRVDEQRYICTMYYVLQPFRVVWKLFFFAFFANTLILFYPLFNYYLNKPERFPLAFQLMKTWAWWLLGLTGIWMSIDKRAPLPEKPFIICPNHSSYLDIIVMYRVFKDYFVFMGKAEINSWPLFHIFFTKGMNISVDRQSSVGAHGALERAKEEADKGHNIVIFPEGTIPAQAPKLKGFKNGAFKLSMEKNIPIVPVTFLTNWKRLQAGPALRNSGGPGPSKVIIHPPVYPADYAEEGITKMRQDIFDIINAPLKEKYGDQRQAD